MPMTVAVLMAAAQGSAALTPRRSVRKSSLIAAEPTTPRLPTLLAAILGYAARCAPRASAAQR
eukprot:3973234-Pleurochrysis_carterae.AAC.1